MTQTAARLRGEGITCAGLDLTAIGQNLSVEQWYDGMASLLARALAEQPPTSSPTDTRVDQLRANLFLSSSARERDDNLLFVRERLLRSDADLAGLLLLYRQVWEGRRVPVDETNPLISLLRLSGVTRVTGGLLKCRNRVYAHVFDKAWVVSHMPDAEVQRQRVAYRRGILRSSAVSLCILTVISVLALAAVRYANVAQTKEAQARVSAADLRHNLYAADTYLAQHALEENDLARARSLLHPYFPKPGEEDLRGFEWRYLWGLTRDQSRRTIDLVRKKGAWSCSRFSPDGRILALSCGDLRLYDAATMRELPPLPPFTANVGSMALSPDGKTLAIREGKDRVALCDLGTRRRIGTLPAPIPEGPKADIAFSPDGRTLAIAGSDSPVRLWDIVSHRQIDSYAGKEFVSFSFDGRLLATKDDEGVVLWDLALRRKRQFGQGRAICAAFSPDSKHLAVGMENGKTWMLNTTTGEMVDIPLGHHEWVYSFDFSSDGRLLASGSTDGTVRLWEPATGQEPRILRGHQGEVVTVAFSHDGKTLVSTGGDSTAKLWDTAPEPRLDSVEGTFATLSGDGRTVATKRPPGSDVTLRDVRTLQKIGAIKWDSRYSQGEPVAFSADGRFAYLLVDLDQGGSKRLLVWDIAARKQAGEIAAADVGWVSFWPSPDGTLLASANGTNIALFDLAARRELKPLEGDFAAFSADGKWLGVSGRDDAYRIVDTRTWKTIAPTLRYGGGGWGPLAFSPDGRLLATATAGGEVAVWDTAFWSLKTSFPAHSGAIKCVVFSADGKTLATSGNDPEVKLWNTATWRLTQTLKTGMALRLQFTPDGNTLLSCFPGPMIHFWRAASLAEIGASETNGSTTR